jgi:general secretion pathway protein G
MQRRHSRGFTLIEMMVVVAILGMLAALIVPGVIKHLDEAKVKTAKVDMRTVEGALKMFKLDNNRYPSSDEGLEALVTQPSDAPNWKQYLEKLKKDPWGGDYQYINNGDGSYEIISLGGDRVEGGEGPNADISNKDL